MKDKSTIKKVLSQYKSALTHISTASGSRSKALAEAFNKYLMWFIPPCRIYFEHIPKECQESFNVLSEELKNCVSKEIKKEREHYKQKGISDQFAMNLINSTSTISKFHH